MMIITDTSIKLNDIVTLKMVGGDEVVGKLLDERTDSYVDLGKPLVVMMGQQGFGLAPYILTAGPDTGAKIDRAHVISMVKTFDAVAKQYIKQTSGLYL